MKLDSRYRYGSLCVVSVTEDQCSCLASAQEVFVYRSAVVSPRIQRKLLSKVRRGLYGCTCCFASASKGL